MPFDAEPGTDIGMTSVSIIIPVYNNAAGLERCLEALTHQDYRGGEVEIVVVDNVSTTDLQDVTSGFSRAKLAYEPTPGAYVARNRGIEVATHEVIAFTDSDCVPDPTWITRGLQALAEDGADLVGGRIELTYEDPDELGLAELYDKYFVNLRQEEFVRENRFAATANLFVKRAVLDRVGGFNEDLKSAGDREWGKRAVDAGFRLVYCDESIIYHPARNRFVDLVDKCRRLVGGHIDLKRARGPYPFQEFLTYLLPHLRPPFMALPRIRRAEPSLRSLRRSLLFFAYIQVLRTVNGVEALRVYVGGKSSR